MNGRIQIKPTFMEDHFLFARTAHPKCLQPPRVGSPFAFDSDLAPVDSHSSHFGLPLRSGSVRRSIFSEEHLSASNRNAKIPVLGGLKAQARGWVFGGRGAGVVPGPELSHLG